MRKYLEEENAYTEKIMYDTKDLQKLFNEIEGRIKLDDESLKFKDKNMSTGLKRQRREITLSFLDEKLVMIKLKFTGMAI